MVDPVQAIAAITEQVSKREIGVDLAEAKAAPLLAAMYSLEKRFPDGRVMGEAAQASDFLQ